MSSRGPWPPCISRRWRRRTRPRATLRDAIASMRLLPGCAEALPGPRDVHQLALVHDGGSMDNHERKAAARPGRVLERGIVPHDGGVEDDDVGIHPHLDPTLLLEPGAPALEAPGG